ncbi:MAG: AAA family ATPase [Anaerolineae bacterium]|nr:AAA family ATPase [Anaerolineae bacterium]
MTTQTAPIIIGQRYRLLDQLGAGGMGCVYLAYDRLTGSMVALKQMLTAPQRLQFTSRRDNDTDVKLALAQEFRVLASLRHPNIISVLDYGFDTERQPYFTMDFLENASTILYAARGQSLAVQVGLLAQMLQALVYLHRRQILHRDLKPANVLVINGQVKVLDFGISVTVDEAGGFAGTLAYLPPESILGTPLDVRADLYAVGIMAYEMFAGVHPFVDHLGETAALMFDVLNTEPDTTKGNLDPRLAAVIDRLVAKAPEDRYANASAVIAALSEATGIPLSSETSATRESLLQSARLVGRAAEMAELSHGLELALQGQGSVWLVGGESGVGKSRLLDELRILALVKGALVTRGQAVSTGGSPYQLWREPLRRLVLMVDLDDQEASALKPLIPDLPTLLGRDIPDAPQLDPEGTQARLFAAVTSLVRRQPQPVVILLEDLHWAGNESLALLARLTRLAAYEVYLGLSVLIVGSYRDDEGALIYQPETRLLKLKRLPPDEIAELSESMLGPAGRQPEIVAFLQQETEGNVFFLIEVVRTLAEEAGQLDEVGVMELPAHILAGGVARIVQRRLNRVPFAAQPLLKAAAAAGRRLDLDILEMVEPDTPLEQWLDTCIETAVIEIREGHIQFAHEKLREGVINNLAQDERRDLHRRVAEAIEEVYLDAPEQIAALAYHWGMAQNTDKEVQYITKAGQQALDSAAYPKAVAFFERALTLRDQQVQRWDGQATPTVQVDRAFLERRIGQAWYGLGNLAEARQHLEQAVSLLGYPIPAARFALMAGLIRETARQGLHRLWPARLTGRARVKRNIVIETAHIYQLLAQVNYFAHAALPGFYAAVRGLNLAESTDRSPELARLYSSMCIAAGVAGLHRPAEVYARLARETAQRLNDVPTMAYVLLTVGLYGVGVGQWKQVQDSFERAGAMYQRLGDRRDWGDSLIAFMFAAYFRGQFDRCVELGTHVRDLGQDIGNPGQQVWGLYGQAMGYLRSGQLAQAAVALQAAQPLIAGGTDVIAEILHRGLWIQVNLRQGDLDTVRHSVAAAASRVAHTRITAISSFDMYAGIAEAWLTLWEADRSPMHASHARRACRALHSFARIFPVARPRASLYDGWANWLSGRPARAHQLWHNSLTAAQTLKMPYEQGLAHYMIGQHLDRRDPERRQHLDSAIACFTELQAADDRQRAEALLSK